MAAEIEWGQIVAKAWTDEHFKRQLLADPATVLKHHGLHVPTGVQVKVVENTDRVLYLTLPQAPSDPEELSEEDLAKSGPTSSCSRECTTSCLVPDGGIGACG